jgi:ribosomal protein L37E
LEQAGVAGIFLPVEGSNLNMALIKCPECQENVSPAAQSCPHCGYPLQADDIAHQEKERCGSCVFGRLSAAEKKAVRGLFGFIIIMGIVLLAKFTISVWRSLF